MSVEVDIDVDLLKSEIKKTYASVSDEPERTFIFPTGRAWAEDLGYPPELANVPAWDFTSVTPGARRKLRQAALRRLETELGEAEVALADVDASLAEIGPPRPPRATPRSTRRR